jgi:uncharacterized membrane protein YkoI
VRTKLSRHKLAAGSALAAVLVGGGVSIAAASPDSPSAPASNAAADQEQTDGETVDRHDGAPGSKQEEQDPAFTGSVQAPADANEPDGQEAAGGEDQEQASLRALATLTPQEAEQAAVAVVPGTVAATDLGNENGSVVYSVEIKGSDGSVTEVVIDAGNGAVLAQQGADEEQPADSADQPEGPNDPRD